MKTYPASMWTKEDLIAYLLIYCANADYIESQDEKDLILSKVGSVVYSRIHKEFERSNDFQHIKNIEQSIQNLNLSKDQKGELLKLMKDFFSENEFNILEQNLLRALNHLMLER